jgi:hypothetical protein
MDTRAAKRIARDAGLSLYYSSEWRSWGLVDPAQQVESLWLSPGQLRTLTQFQFVLHYVTEMQSRIHPNVGQAFPVADTPFVGQLSARHETHPLAPVSERDGAFLLADGSPVHPQRLVKLWDGTLTSTAIQQLIEGKE